MKKKITIFGSTGSIGESTLDIINHHPEKYEVIGLTINNNYKKLKSHDNIDVIKSMSTPSEHEAELANDLTKDVIEYFDQNILDIFNKKRDIQVAYAIGVAEPVGLYINTYETGKLNLSDSEIAEKINQIFDMRPYAIEQRFNLRSPIYSETAAYGHMGRKLEKVTKEFTSADGKKISIEVELFPWEKLDYVDKIKAKF